MATVHVCDCCGVEVDNRSDLWEVAFSPAEKVRGVPGKRRYERFELCDRCKKRVYVAANEPPFPKGRGQA